MRDEMPYWTYEELREIDYETMLAEYRMMVNIMDSFDSDDLEYPPFLEDWNE